jgi:hypothetical protein
MLEGLCPSGRYLYSYLLKVVVKSVVNNNLVSLKQPSS